MDSFKKNHICYSLNPYKYTCVLDNSESEIDAIHKNLPKNAKVTKFSTLSFFPRYYVMWKTYSILEKKSVTGFEITGKSKKGNYNFELKDIRKNR